MEREILKIAAEVAGLGGLALGVLLLVCRDVLTKNIFPNLTKKQGYALLRLIVVLVWSVALIGRGAWTYLQVQERRAKLQSESRRPDLRLAGAIPYLFKYGFSTAIIFDINIVNQGEVAGLLTKLRINVLHNYPFSYDRCPPCRRIIANGVYDISLTEVLKGQNEYLLQHEVQPRATERISLIFGGSFRERSYLARLSLTLITGEEKTITTEPFDTFNIYDDA
jgi:hypothetical protein